MLLATLVFSGMHACIKALSSFHVLEIIFFRSAITAGVCVYYLRSQGVSLIGNRQKYLLLRAVFGIISMALFFITLQHMPMGASVSLKYLSPLFAALFAAMYLRETIRPIQWICFALACCGIFLLKGFDTRIENLDLVLGVSGAVFGGLVYVMIRKIGNTEHPMVVINYFMLSAAVLAGIGMIPFWRTPVSSEWLTILAVGILGYFGQVYMTKALQMELTSRVAPVKYAEVINSMIIAMIWFGETYTLTSLLGILLILSLVVPYFVKKPDTVAPSIRFKPL